jgi:hypothetical protein
MSGHQSSKFNVPTELTLGGAGLESITAEGYQLLIDRLKLMGIEPVGPPRTAVDYPIVKDDVLARTEEIGYSRTMGTRTWKALTGNGRYPRVLSILSPLVQPAEADFSEIQKIPDWMHGLYLTPDSLSYRGLSRALQEDRIRSLRNISDAGHQIIETTVAWAQEQIAQ